ncbi:MULTISPECIES: RNA ligase [Candidatus Brocadia]|uniref:ATP dependent DNA ligase n=1 Tax=Candidatus Brocadia sinica JPN1 TaxID=1197129 RepID=A0ABQ0JXW8_9BACT|nr:MULTISPECIES: RNA ligase [Brocadia]NOG40610.1 RNA ligase [Planctomycetota bacterium]GAN33592.1 ATP dependent DNA ligase [Candidatus Brocadia sinica JPN1]GIK13420.1 MAG: RNA ligase [Candidatus Brocadia sinica]GJQ18375.1 MAG: RNA ligase [Candidatus Brocadia sinica]
MQMYNIVKQIGISEDLWQESIKKRDAIHDEFDGIDYYRVTKKIGTLGKGSIVTQEGIIFGFPSIARILHLENGIRNAYTQPFYVEEKVDGYNVRVARIQGRIAVFSRGAYICPFSTDRIVDFLDAKKLFDENPDLVVCGEFAGPDNPYNIEHPPYVKEDVRFFAFDLMMMNKHHKIPIDERYKIFDTYRIPTVRRFGQFSASDISALKKVIKELDETGCEGIVMKPTHPAEKILKYVTLGSCLRDIRVTAPLMAEMASEFFTHRIIRAAMFIHEHGNSLEPEVFVQLGRVLLKPVYESVTKAAQDKLIDEKFSLRFREEKNIQKMIDHLYRCKVKFDVLSENKEDAYWCVKFVRKCYASYEILQKHLEGSAHVD